MEMHFLRRWQVFWCSFSAERVKADVSRYLGFPSGFTEWLLFTLEEGKMGEAAAGLISREQKWPQKVLPAADLILFYWLN